MSKDYFMIDDTLFDLHLGKISKDETTLNNG